MENHAFRDGPFDAAWSRILGPARLIVARASEVNGPEIHIHAVGYEQSG